MAGNLDIALLELLNGSGSSFFDALMLTLTSGYLWIGLYVALLYLVINNSETMSQILLVVGCALMCVMLSGGLSDLVVKPVVGRLRPINDYALSDVIFPVCNYRPKGFSFFSSHAANTMSLTVFFSLLVRNRNLFVAMLLWSLTNCYTRLYLGVHFPSDILTGLLWGAAAGAAVYWFYTRIYAKVCSTGDFISTQYTSKGYTIVTIDIVITVLSATYIVAIMRALIIA